MRLLFDTYILLWLITDSPRVQEIKPVVEHFINDVYFSSDNAIAVNRLADPDTENKDPFDRILIAQAKTEQMRLITADEKIAAYPEPCIWKI